MSVWWSSPSNSSFWGSFLPLQEMQNWRLQTNLGLGEWPCQTAGSASRRLLSSAAQLPKPCEAWHARKGSPVGTAGCPHHLQIRIPSSATLPLPTLFCREGTRKHKDQKQESGDLRPVGTLPLHEGCFTPPASDSHLKGSPFQFWPQIQGLFSELWHYVRNARHREGLPSMFTGGKGAS